MNRAFDFVAGRRGKWIVVLVWILLLGFAGAKAGGFEDAQVNDSESRLPESAESLAALQLEKKLPGGEQTPGIVVFQRADGLTKSDKAAIEEAAESLRSKPLVDQVGQPQIFFTPDGKTATLNVAYEAKGRDDALGEAAYRLRALADAAPDGVEAYLTGGIGYGDDAASAFESLDTKLLLGTALVVIVLLLLIYRSPFLWMIPLVAVLFAESLTRAAGTVLAENGMAINGQAAGIMTVLVFGVGTDYALLLTSRYREELRRWPDKHDAMRSALHASVPTIVASGTTVAAALFVLLLADNNGTQALGPIAAFGVIFAMIAMLTLLPALLLVFGRRAFWPFVPKHEHADYFPEHGFWTRLGRRVQAHPRRTWLLAFSLMAILALGLTSYSENLTQNRSYTNEVDSVRGEELLKRSLPPGYTAPTTVIIRGDEAAVQQAREVLESDREVAQVLPGAISAGDLTKISVTFRSDPYASEARSAIPRLRAELSSNVDGETLVGGPTAVNHDQRESSRRDSRIVIPVALVLVLLILITLLRALVLPVVLLATVVASFFAALGASAFAFEYFFDYPGSDPSMPLYVFIFLVALGVDYNIFLMARAREETIRHGTAEGMLRALAATGGVITSAGIVLAGTFSILMTLPLIFMVEIGFAVAFGVLFDALVVRSVLVPALVFDIGPKIWWPSKLAAENRQEANSQVTDAH